MLDWTRNSSGLKTLPEKFRDDVISMLEKEINIDFQRSMNKITFDNIVSNNRDTFAFVTLPPKIDDFVPERGCIDEVPAYDFEKLVQQALEREQI
jgi:dynein heavy chain